MQPNITVYTAQIKRLCQNSCNCYLLLITMHNDGDFRWMMAVLASLSVWSSWDSVWAISVRLSALVHALVLHISILHELIKWKFSVCKYARIFFLFFFFSLFFLKVIQNPELWSWTYIPWKVLLVEWYSVGVTHWQWSQVYCAAITVSLSQYQSKYHYQPTFKTLKPE